MTGVIVDKVCAECGNPKMKLFQSPVSDIFHCPKCNSGTKTIHLDKALSYKAPAFENNKKPKLTQC